MRGYMGAWVRVRKLVDSEFTITMKMKVVTLDEETPRRQFLYTGDQSKEPVGPKMNQ